eukprot:8787979-Alexandrium_andersonii.AAC.1
MSGHERSRARARPWACACTCARRRRVQPDPRPMCPWKHCEEPRLPALVNMTALPPEVRATEPE